jgi:hypothetical protein
MGNNAININIVEWYADNLLVISIAVSVIFSLLLYLLKASKKEWRFREIELVQIVTLILSISTIPHAFALVLCSFNLLKLEDIQGFNVYMLIAAVALFYVSILVISNFFKN